LGGTRDVSMIAGTVEALDLDALPQEQRDRFAARTGFDPRAESSPYRWFRITPRRIQAWREVDELPGRELMRDGEWLVGAGSIGSGDTGGARDDAPAPQLEGR
jgi:hypothetical protein